MPRCESCGGQLAAEFRYCPWCSHPQRVKIVEFFSPHPAFAETRDRVLRVSWYLHGIRHVRLSIWRGDRAESVAALDEAEAERLGRFLLAIAERDRSERASVVSAALEHVRALTRR